VTLRATSVDALIRKAGPILSGDLARLLRDTGVTDVNARKLIQRSRATVRRLTGIRFPNKEQFLFLDEQFGSDRFWEKLFLAFDERSTIYGHTIHSLLARDGSVPVAQFPTITGAPSRLKGQIGTTLVRGHLEAIQLLHIQTYKDLGDCVELDPRALRNGPVAYGRLRARLLAERILLLALADWLRRLGIGSYHKVVIRSDGAPPEFGKFSWDLTAPSYLPPFAGRLATGKPNPGFVVADVALGAELTDRQIGYFIRKTTTLRANPRNRPFLAILIADGFTPDAFKLGRQSGVMLAPPEYLFGGQIAEGLRSLIASLSNAAAAAAQNPEVVTTLFGQLARIEGAAINLRGPLFELLVGHFAKRHGYYIELGKRVEDPQTQLVAEIDVYGFGPDLVHTFECKGYLNQTVQLSEVEHWFDKTIPVVRSHMQYSSDHRNKRLRCEFWTTSSFAPDAFAFLQDRKQRTRRFDIDWADGPTIRQRFGDANERRLREILDEHFLKHPIAT
jgi:hypothetical protein